MPEVPLAQICSYSYTYSYTPGSAWRERGVNRHNLSGPGEVCLNLLVHGMKIMYHSVKVPSLGMIRPKPWRRLVSVSRMTDRELFCQQLFCRECQGTKSERFNKKPRQTSVWLVALVESEFSIVGDGSPDGEPFPTTRDRDWEGPRPRGPRSARPGTRVPTSASRDTVPGATADPP